MLKQVFIRVLGKQQSVHVPHTYNIPSAYYNHFDGGVLLFVVLQSFCWVMVGNFDTEAF